MSERDTHFLGFARALLNDIFDDREGSLILGKDLYPQDNERVAQHIARRAYDLVYHALYCNGVDAWYRPGKDYHPTVFYERKVTEHTNEIPDLTELPE